MQELALYYIVTLLPVWLYHIFSHYQTNGTVIGRKLIAYKISVSIFSTILSQIFLILRINERGTIKNVHMSSCKFPVILDKFQSSFDLFGRVSETNIKFNENLFGRVSETNIKFHENPFGRVSETNIKFHENPFGSFGNKYKIS